MSSRIPEDPLRWALAAEYSNSVTSAVADLPVFEQYVVRAYFGLGRRSMSAREIADEVNDDDFELQWRAVHVKTLTDCGAPRVMTVTQVQRIVGEVLSRLRADETLHELFASDVRPLPVREALPTCAACGREMPPTAPTGRPRKYCNAACRQKARRIELADGRRWKPVDRAGREGGTGTW